MTTGTTVVNLTKTDEYDVFVGRPSKWGNPFVIGQDGTRKEVIRKYERWLLDQPELLDAIPTELAGKRLACFCKPLACHGDILAWHANRGDIWD